MRHPDGYTISAKGLYFSEKPPRRVDHQDGDDDDFFGPRGSLTGRTPLRSEREAAVFSRSPFFDADVAASLKIVRQPACGCSDEELAHCLHSC